MTDEPRRPSRSDIKPAPRRLLCQACGGEHWHRQTGPLEWTCQGCGAPFWQNPWISEDHELIRAPVYDIITSTPYVEVGLEDRR